MTPVLHAHLADGEVYVLPELRRDDVDAIVASGRYRPEYRPPCCIDGKFGGGLAEVFMWVLTSCAGLPRPDADDVFVELVQRERLVLQRGFR
jgi:hypothetical protein